MSGAIASDGYVAIYVYIDVVGACNFLSCSTIPAGILLAATTLNYTIANVGDLQIVTFNNLIGINGI